MVASANCHIDAAFWRVEGRLDNLLSPLTSRHFLSLEPVDRNMNKVSWNAGTIRLTALYSDQVVRPLMDGFAQVFGIAAEVQIRDKRQGIEQDFGKLDDRSAILTSASGRLELIFGPVAEADAAAPQVQGWSLTQALESARHFSSSWSAFATQPHRIAFGVELKFTVSSREEGYKVLQQYLACLQIDPVNSSDLSYQINRPRLLNTSGSSIRVNRLSRWSSRTKIPLLLRTVFNESGPQSSSAQRGEMEQYAGADIDVNTDASREASLGEEKDVHELYLKMVALAEEIAEKGDIA